MSDMRQFGVVICRHPIENPKWNSKGGHLDAHCAYVAAPGPPGVRKLWPFGRWRTLALWSLAASSAISSVAMRTANGTARQAQTRNCR
jgi:hypothetical protein